MTSAIWGIVAGMTLMFGFALYQRGLWNESGRSFEPGRRAHPPSTQIV